ncbi:hypothetical protein K435DRAFT_781012 [Dendrothele bispora CBS 962.96]|uniref:Uncharacterized protein n=1 Tax=Dendrothele bispora (strain CBS 962.96) TaxID=1314807 RepID=A0A4S8LPY5_DENBC|nr:hypothetical protein K435DRAFT_781012 [Dendrothele bispora CBS 962.96]
MNFEDDVGIAAFKILPISACVRRASSVGGGEDYGDVADELATAQSCKEAVELVVDSIRKACEDVGVAEAEFVKNEDVVSLVEAQRMTSIDCFGWEAEGDWCIYVPYYRIR